MEKFSIVRNNYLKNDLPKDRHNIKLTTNKLEGGLRTQGHYKKTNKTKILISVVTVVFNGKSSIENSIQSVLNQDYDNIEYIIIDGGSTDGTLNIIKKYNDYIDYWVSEKDNGIGDAWNKGIQLCKGIYIGILNADDIYHVSNISTISKLYNRDRNPNIVYYGNCYYTSNGKIIRTNQRSFEPNEIINGISFAHTTCFISKIMYTKVGFFNISYKIAVDTEYILRIFKTGGEFQKANLKTYMSVGGVSDVFFENGQLEYARALKELKIGKLPEIEKRIRFVKKYSYIRKFKNIVFYTLIKQKVFNALPTLYSTIYSSLPSHALKTKFLKKLAIYLGEGSRVGQPIKISNVGNIIIGKNSIISEKCILDNKDKITIGNNVIIANGVELKTSEPDMSSPYLELLLNPITIEDNVHIEENVIVKPGVTIKKGAVILSESIVTHDVEENEIFNGRPLHKSLPANSNIKS